MKRIINIGIGISLLWIVLSNCVDKFDAHLPNDNIGLLIVEGNIISDSTVVFCLSRSFSLDMKTYPQDYNRIEAEVSVQGSDGSLFSGVPLGNGRYQVAVGTLNKDIRYSLKIVYDGDTYTSAPQCPLETEEIEDVTYEQLEEYGDIHIRLSTRSKEAAYYLWSYEEDWEVRAEYVIQWFYNPETDEVTYYEDAPYARGWCHNESSVILIGTTEHNADNRLKDKQLYSVIPNDMGGGGRVSCCYSTLMKQRKITRGEYEYYQDKIKFNDEMGGLFTPQPSELPTNITCSNPQKQAIGYIGASMNIAKYRMFISYKDITYEQLRDCRLLDVTCNTPTFIELYMMNYRLAFYSPITKRDTTTWAPLGCTDVRDLGATLDIPSFWPEKSNIETLTSKQYEEEEIHRNLDVFTLGYFK